MTKRVWTSDETLAATVEVAHFGPKPIPSAVAAWTLAGSDGKSVASGRLPARLLPIGNGISLGEIRVPLGGVKAPAETGPHRVT